MNATDLKYRLIVATEPDFQKVRQLLDLMEQPQPHPVLSCAWVAEDVAGNIVALSVMQSVPIVEPFKLAPGNNLDALTGGQVLHKLLEMTHEFVVASGAPRVVMHTSHPAMKRLLYRIGARTQDDQWFNWLKEKAGAANV